MNYIPFKQNQLWGIMDENQEILIEAKYQFLSSNAYYPKNFFKVTQTNEYDNLLEYYFINEKDERVSDFIPLSDKGFECRVYSNKKEEMLFSILVDGKSIYYDYDGDRVFDKEFDYDSEHRIFFKNFHKVLVDGKKGVIDKQGDFLVEPIYDEILIHWDGEYIVLNLKDKIELYDIKKDIYRDFGCEDIKISKEFIFIKKQRYAIFTKEFKKLTEYKYQEITTNEDGTLILAKEDDKAGVLDKNLKIIIPFIYDSLGLVYNDGTKHSRMIAQLDGSSLVIDDKNRVVFSSEHNHTDEEGVCCWDYSYSYNESLDGYIEWYEDKVLFFTQDDKKEFQVESDSAYSFSDDIYVTLYDGEKQGFINLKTEYIQESIFSDFFVFEEDRVSVCLDNKWGVMDGDGNYLLYPKCVDSVHEYPFEFYKSLVNLTNYDLEFLDSYESFSLNGEFIICFDENKSDLYFIEDLKR
ncbi:MAG: WG repeat-containing protein [Campylobacterota bacterium]|nr:WG repeat-containing protein [Campylobacterota bacterium]